MEKALDAIYDLSSTQVERENAWRENQIDSKIITSQYELDDIDKAIVWASGILAGAVDAFFVTDVRRLDKYSKMKVFDKDGNAINLSESGKVNTWVDKRIKNIYTPEQIRHFENKYWVPYDLPNDEDVVGLGPRTHRIQSFGHDPIFGFFFGVRDIMQGTMTAIDNSGAVIVKKVSNGDIGLFEAIATEFGHLKSDICTSSGLPIPFMGQLMRMQGHSDINGYSYQMLIKGMYMKGYNINHLISMGIPALIIEVLIRTSYFAYSLYQGKTFEEALPIGKPKVNKMLFYSYLIATSCNGIKLVATNGNIFAFNPSLWGMCIKYGLSEIKRWLSNQEERERHEYVMHLREESINNIDEIIKNDLLFYEK